MSLRLSIDNEFKIKLSFGKGGFSYERELPSYSK